MNLDQRLLRQARESRFALALTIGLGAAAGVLTVLQARFLSRVIGQVFLAGQFRAGVAPLLAVLLGIILLKAALAWGSELAANAIAVRVKTGLRRQLFEHLQSLGPAFTSTERTGELISAASEGIEALDAYFSQYLPQLVLAALVPLSFLCFIFPLDWVSGVVLLLTAPLIPVFMILIGSQAAALTRRQWQSLSRMSAVFLDVIQGLATLKILGRSRDQVQVIARISERFRQSTMSVLRVSFLSALALEMVSTLSTAVVAVEIGLRLLYGRLSFEQAFFVLLLAPEFYLPLRMLGTRFHAGMSGVAAAKRIFAILETTTEKTTDDPPPAAALNQPSVVHHPSSFVSFHSVHYTYNDGRPALRGVSFEIEAGQTVALVGPSGAGKSTLASLLLRYFEPTQGCITVGGRPLEEFSPAGWRAQIAWVSQNPYLFDASVADNIRLAHPQANLEEILRAARLAHADEFILSLPEGYDTHIGERGMRLSGGQAQRIALARAFLKNAPLLILDEASANLDPENEALLQDSLQRLLQNHTALIIAHRLSTVTRADRIIVLEEGRVAECGTYASLLQQRGLYHRLLTAHTHPVETSRRDVSKLEANTISHPEVAHQETEASHQETPDPGTPHPETSHRDVSTPLHGRSPLLRLVSFVAPFKGLVALSVLLGFGTIGSGIGLMMTSAYVIAMAALHPSIAVLQVAIVGVRFFGITRGLFRYLERYISHQVTFRLLSRLRVWFYQALEPLAPARLAGYHSGDLLSRIVGDIEALENFYVRALAPPLVAVLVALVMAFVMARYDPVLALALLVFLFAAGAGVPLLMRVLSRDAGWQLVSQRAALNVSLIDGIQGLPDLLAFGQEQRQAEKVEAISQSLARAQKQMARLTGLQSALMNLLASLGMWTVLLLAIPLVESGRIEGVALSVVVLGALSSFEAVLPLPLAAQYLESNLQAARRLFELVDAQSEVQDPPHPLPLPQDFTLEVRDVCFRYPVSTLPCERSSASGGDQGGGQGIKSLAPLTLDHLTFTLPQGKRLAVVGPSGAGKSTLVNLLLRFWDYDTGEICLGGHELRQYSQEELRCQFGVISQRTDLFNATLRENLLIARPTATQSDLIRAAQQAQLHDLIQSLPEGYDTWIGEQGLRLSSGQRQRLAIARALLKDAPILILDEATASLDTLTEREVLQAIDRLMKGRTVLMITHRLVGLENMDEILVMQKGRVVERGCHAALLARRGQYRRMWELQNQALLEN